MLLPSSRRPCNCLVILLLGLIALVQQGVFLFNLRYQDSVDCSPVPTSSSLSSGSSHRAFPWEGQSGNDDDDDSSLDETDTDIEEQQDRNEQSEGPLDGQDHRYSTSKKDMLVQPRAFDPWPRDRELPCYAPPDHWRYYKVQRTPSRTGFLMNKLLKVGGSTAAGVNLRIARNYARRYRQTNDTEPCNMRNDHAAAFSMEYGNRDKESSFLWTMIRDPTKRVISEFFHFQVAREKVEPSDVNFKNYLRNPRNDEYYLLSLSMERFRLREAKLGFKSKVAEQILKDYDFVGITERFDESIVALKMILGVEMADVLYLNAKGNGGFDDGGHKGTCFFIQPSYVSPGMKEYFSSPEWTKRVEGDTALYIAANRSLDLTIDKLGREAFNSELAEFKTAQNEVNKECLPKVRFPCSPGGQRQRNTDCIWADSGCGASCLDRVSKKLGLFREDSLMYF